MAAIDFFVEGSSGSPRKAENLVCPTVIVRHVTPEVNGIEQRLCIYI